MRRELTEGENRTQDGAFKLGRVLRAPPPRLMESGAMICPNTSKSALTAPC
jgi:hypothetical protein